jgi:hypothetical protein
MKRKPPGSDFDLESLSHDSKERHDSIVDLLGQYIFWMRNWSVSRSKEFVESDEARGQLGAIQRERFDGIASLAPKDKEAAIAFAEATVDDFCDLLLRFLGNEGYDLRVGSGEAVQVLLEMVFINVESDQVVDREIVNRDGNSMPKYWGRWLNRYGKKVDKE